MFKLRDFLRRLRDLMTCFRRTVVIIDGVLEDIEEAVEVKRSESSQTVAVDL